jgi:hypothetical protein
MDANGVKSRQYIHPTWHPRQNAQANSLTKNGLRLHSFRRNQEKMSVSFRKKVIPAIVSRSISIQTPSLEKKKTPSWGVVFLRTRRYFRAIPSWALQKNAWISAIQQGRRAWGS